MCIAAGAKSQLGAVADAGIATAMARTTIPTKPTTINSLDKRLRDILTSSIKIQLRASLRYL
jgi:hypothetical protein